MWRPLKRQDSHVAEQMVERAAELAKDSHAQTRYAISLEKESMKGIPATFGDRAQNEWLKAYNEWDAFGHHVFDAHNEVPIDGKLVRHKIVLYNNCGGPRYARAIDTFASTVFRDVPADELQALCFLAGANSIFVGDTLLTADNPGEDHDAALFRRLGIEPAPLPPPS